MQIGILEWIRSAVRSYYDSATKVRHRSQALASVAREYGLEGRPESEVLAHISRERELARKRRFEALFEALAQKARDRDWIPLQEKNIAAESIELRIWKTITIGLRSEVEVTLIQREGDSWAGFRDNGQYSGQVAPSLVVGWDGLWEEIKKLGILSLPDSSFLPSINSSVLCGGTFYDVEINDGGEYRAYSYDNPEYKDWPEAKALLEIMQVLRDSLWTYDDETAAWNRKFLGEF